MKKTWLLLIGAAMGLSSCTGGTTVEVFSAFNLRAPKIPCAVNTTTGARELSLAFNYTGTLRGLNLTFTPSGKPSQKASITDVSNPPIGLRIDPFTAGDAKLYVDLEKIVATTQRVEQPNPVTSYPLDVEIEALGKTTDAKIVLPTLTNIDVANCYAPAPAPVKP